MTESHDYRQLVKEHGGIRPAARFLNMPESTLRGRIRRQKVSEGLNMLGLKTKDADTAVMDDLTIRGTSRYYKLENGGIWVKTEREKVDELRAIEAVVEAMRRDITPLKPIKSTPYVEDDLMAVHVLSDFHLGMFAHKEEGGADWDLKEAERVMHVWIDKALSLTPPAHTGVFLQLGDFLHTDGLAPVTPQSRHVLDNSSRFQKMVDVAIDGSRYAISRMLEKHKHVHVIMADGNHDQSSSVWLRAAFARLYEDEPRVTVDTTEHPYYCYEWGDTSIFAHHGDKKGLTDVSKAFATQYREVFGRTKHSYGHIGHYHHAKRRPVGDDGLMDVQIHPTLAARDAYAARGAYFAQRKAKSMLYCKKHGYVGEHTVTPGMLI